MFDNSEHVAGSGNTQPREVAATLQWQWSWMRSRNPNETANGTRQLLCVNGGLFFT